MKSIIEPLPIGKILGSVAQYSVAYCTAVGQISADLLLCVAATQLLMHYDYIAHCIETYRIKSKMVTNGVKHDMEFLRNIIIYHEKLLSLSDMLNDVFGVPLLVNFMSSACLMCFLGFQLTTGVSTEILLKLLLFLFSSSAQAYLICYFGQKLLEASAGISNAVYIHNWFEADLKYKKMLVQMARRAQRPAVLKATVLINISNVTMTDLLQISYKFFALLRTMYN
ncbi:odorant receptor 85b-like [Teleopsis dalmanni]|uniref:odorant receptor 85b-like n=1 Tax=Teleopsis dalmanni TaxID=139649 RepID=UPI0018CC9BFE|nr:odorant receptor 85b-like [Teleopsis dalmanni]